MAATFGDPVLPFPSVVDSTFLVAFRNCEQRGAYAHGHNFSLGETSLDLHFGGAFAAGMEVTRKAYFVHGKPSAEAICLGLNAASDYWGRFIAPLDKAKSWDTLMLSFDGYFQQWPLETDPVRPALGGTAIEFSFAIPIPEVMRPDGQGPVVYGGRFDMIGELEGMLLGVDEKSTSSGFGSDWAKKWSLRNQFMGYCWGAQQHGIYIDKFLVRGINVLKTKTDYAQAMPEYNKFLIERWYAQLVKDLHRMVAKWQTGEFNLDFGDACTMFGKTCDFMPLCSARNPADWFSMYQIRKWDPLAKDPTQTNLLAA